jgi:hypothetical protein
MSMTGMRSNSVVRDDERDRSSVAGFAVDDRREWARMLAISRRVF